MKTVEARFWEKVDRSTDCWEWTASRNRDGYGHFWFEGRMTVAHRVAYRLAFGDLGHLQVDHICRNRGCVRPNHLRAVTHKQNQENRGPNRRGSSGARGVTWNRLNGMWKVQVGHNGAKHRGGDYLTIDEAAEAARLLRLSLFTHNDEDRVSNDEDA